MKPGNISIYLIITASLALMAPIVLAENQGGLGGPQEGTHGHAKTYNGLINEWETEPIQGIIDYEGKKGGAVVRPSWFVVSSERPESEWQTPPYYRIGAPYVFDLVHIGPDGKVQRKVPLGIGSEVRVSEDGHRFAVYKRKWPEGYGRSKPSVMEFEILDNAGNLKKRFEGSKFSIVYMAPGGSHTIALGDKHGVIEVYDSKFKLVASYGKPDPNPEIYFQGCYSSKDGYFGIACAQNDSRIVLYLFDRTGRLITGPIPLRNFYTNFNHEGFNEEGIYQFDLFPKQGMIVFQGSKKIEGKQTRYITATDFNGNSIFSDVLTPTVLGMQIQISDAGNYIRGFNTDLSYLLDRKGALLYKIPHSLGDESAGAGLLSDDGTFVGFLPKFQQLVLVNRAGQIDETPTPKPGMVEAFDVNRGLVLSKEEYFIGPNGKGEYDVLDKFVERRLPPDTLAETKLRGGLR